MSALPPRYYRLFEENENMGLKLSAKVGGAGDDACEDLKQPLAEIFKEWRKEWAKKGLLPKRPRRVSL
jgi:hypothetical protein